MFPTMEEDVIEAVLRANDGAVDATIDQLLTMSIDAGNEEVIDPVTHTAMVSLPEISLMHRSRKNITDKQGPYNLKLYFFLN